MSKKGYKQTKESIKKRIISRRKNGWWKNPEKSKKKMSEAHKGKTMPPFTEEQKKK